MSYSTSSTRTSGAGGAIASVFVAGVMFVLGYTVVRASLAESAQVPVASSDADVQVVVPGEGTLWADFGVSF